MGELSLPRFPSTERLTSGLNTVFNSSGSGQKGDVTVLSRKKNKFQSTFPSEIVTCHQSKNGIIRVFCKYGTNHFDNGYGHRGGVPYEARVYEKILAPLHLSTPKLYGVHKEKESGRTWLVIEYLEGASQDISRTNEAVIHAARWIGRFHAVNEKRVSNSRLGFLQKYDLAYYKGWARRSNRLFRNQRSELPWLPRLCIRFEQLAPSLLTARKTVIHGEYYPSNVIYTRSTSRPADWQSAAVAPGLIDLAALTQNWPRRMVERMVREYKRTTWPEGEPSNFDELFKIARVYMILRWLGDPAVAVPWIRRSIFKRQPHHLSQESKLLLRKYKRFIEALSLERETLEVN